jgi:energy-converting hydrogenase B subunit D
MEEKMILEILLLFLVAASILFVAAKTLLKSLVFLSLNTLLLVIILFLLQAPDVAITMAVVGTGATTVLYLSTIKKLGGIH